jgi:2-oxo-4-hydroxy-4-carboxy-5-ureidoimidazoline decarboxylase
MPGEPGLDAFNRAPVELARKQLLACCASIRWTEQMLATRPFPSIDAALDAADRCSASLTPADITEALSAHPRIGERADGDSADARWSRQEQAAVTSAEDDVKVQLRRQNRAYEARFDQVFLIRAAGRTPTEILAELNRRLGNTPVTEAAEVAEQLRQITRLRLQAVLDR